MHTSFRLLGCFITNTRNSKIDHINKKLYYINLLDLTTGNVTLEYVFSTCLMPILKTSLCACGAGAGGTSTVVVMVPLLVLVVVRWL